jgi:hypothetical protein
MEMGKSEAALLVFAAVYVSDNMVGEAQVLFVLLPVVLPVVVDESFDLEAQSSINGDESIKRVDW